MWVGLAFASVALAGPVKAQDVTLSSGSEVIAGYLAAPDSPGAHPALVVIHDDWGLTDWVKLQSRRLAGEGYVALAVDLYRGQVAHDPEFAYDLMVSVQSERALPDLKAAINFLAARPDVNKDKIGTIGWSMGGKWAVLLAATDPLLGACVVNYGTLPTDPAVIDSIQAPVLGIFGADDRTIPRADVDDFEAAMAKAHKAVEIKVYTGASDGFESSDNKLGFREGAADDAWQRTVAFLGEHLKK